MDTHAAKTSTVKPGSAQGVPPVPVAKSMDERMSVKGKALEATKPKARTDADNAKKNGTETDFLSADKTKAQTIDTGGIAGKRLLAFLERVERLEEEKSEIAEDLKEVYAEAKATGYDTKTMKKLIKLRAMDIEKRREEDELLTLYANAIQLSLF